MGVGGLGLTLSLTCCLSASTSIFLHKLSFPGDFPTFDLHIFHLGTVGVWADMLRDGDVIYGQSEALHYCLPALCWVCSVS